MEEEMREITNRFLSVYTPTRVVRALAEYEDYLVQAMDGPPEKCLSFRDIDGEYIYIRAEDIEMVLVSTAEGRKKLDTFFKIMDEEGPNEWES